MGVAFGNLGQYEKALDATRESLKLYPENVTAYENLGEFYIALNRFSEARDITAQAQARKLDDFVLHLNLYTVAFQGRDSSGMAKHAAWFEGKSEYQNNILGAQSATESYFGRLSKANELTSRAIASAESVQDKESRGPTPYKATMPMLVVLTLIFSRCGRTPTPESPSISRPSRSTPD